MVKALLLLFTALFTPFEIAFLETELDAFFFINRIVDVGFAIDILVNFNLAFHTLDGNLMKDRRIVRVHYLKVR